MDLIGFDVTQSTSHNANKNRLKCFSGNLKSLAYNANNTMLNNLSHLGLIPNLAVS